MHPKNDHVTTRTAADLPLKVVLIEDDLSYARLVDFWLDDKDLIDCQLQAVDTLEKGLAVLRGEEDTDAVLLDLTLPDSRGLETLSTLLKHFPGQNVIVLTSSTDRRQGDQAMALGAQDYLIKNEFSGPQLIRTLRYAVERRQIQARLREAQRIAKLGYWECCPARHSFWASPEVYVFFGLDPLQALAYDEATQQRELFACLRAMFQETAPGSIHSREFALASTEPNGRVLTVSCRAKRADPTVVHYSGTMQDITLIKQAEILQRERDLAEERARTREQIVANVSHELRTPMNAIMGMSNLLADTPLNAEQLEYVTSIHEATQILLGIVNDILLTSSLQRGEVPLDDKPFQPATTVSRLVETMAPKAAAKSLRLDCRIHQGVPDMVVGDKQRFSQILYNLVGNAIKFTHHGSVTIHLNPALGNEESRQYLLVRVVDTGIGIPEAKQQEIFEAFTRVHQPGQTAEGTGLGLTIAKALVTQMGGELSLESREGEGSVFSFILPFAAYHPAESAKKPNDPPREEVTLQGKHVLIVEDHLMNQVVIQRTLAKRWPLLEIKVVGSGEEAIEFLREHGTDLILMDLQMPGQDGFATSRYIRQHFSDRLGAVPIIAMTAHAQVATDGRYLTSGMNGYVLKPFEPDGLFAKILRHMT